MQVERFGNERIEIRSVWSDSRGFWLGGAPLLLAFGAVLLMQVPMAIPEVGRRAQIAWLLASPLLVLAVLWYLFVPRSVVSIDFPNALLRITHRRFFQASTATYAWRDITAVTLQFGEDDNEAWAWLQLRSGEKVRLLQGLLQRRHAEYAAGIVRESLWPAAPLHAAAS